MSTARHPPPRHPLREAFLPGLRLAGLRDAGRIGRGGGVLGRARQAEPADADIRALDSAAGSMASSASARAPLHGRQGRQGPQRAVKGEERMKAMTSSSGLGQCSGLSPEDVRPDLAGADEFSVAWQSLPRTDPQSA